MADEEEKEEAEEEEAEEEEAEEEGDGEDEDGEEDGEGGKKKKKKKGGKLKIIIIAVVLLVAIAVPAALYFMGFFSSEVKHEVVEGEEGEEIIIGEDGLPEQAVFYDLEEFIANLDVGSKRPSFLKMTVSLELPGESQIPRLESKMPRIRDSFQLYLRELRQQDLQGSAGIYRLREELLLRVNKVIYPAKVSDILFKEILVQ